MECLVDFYDDGTAYAKKTSLFNAVKVTVDPLPATTLPVNAIGTLLLLCLN